MEEPAFTTSHASRWLGQRENESHTTHYSRINASRQFLKHLSIKEYDVHVVWDVKYKGTDFIPLVLELISIFEGHIADETLALCDGLRSYHAFPGIVDYTVKDCNNRNTETMIRRLMDTVLAITGANNRHSNMDVKEADILIT